MIVDTLMVAVVFQLSDVARILVAFGWSDSLDKCCVELCGPLLISLGTTLPFKEANFAGLEEF